MNSFNYFAPKTVTQALDLLGDLKGETKLLAGGTDLILLIRREDIPVKNIVDLWKVKELRFIKEEEGFIKIGSMTTFTDIEKSSLINEKARSLAQASRDIGSPLIRNRGTIGGNIVTASPAADSVPALLALEAKVVLESPEGLRELELSEVLCGVHKNNLKEEEILTQIYFPAPNSNTSTAFRKLGRRAALSISRLSVAVTMEKEDDLCKDVKIALGSVAQNPIRAPEAENILVNRKLSEELLESCIKEISHIAVKAIGNRPSAPFKKESIKGVSRDVLISLYHEMGFSD